MRNVLSTRRNCILATLGLITLWALWVHDVPKSPTPAEVRVLSAMLDEREYGELFARSPLIFQEEIERIVAAQDAVLARAPDNRGLPMGFSREPTVLYEARYGLCYDRSRAIEKVLQMHGFDVRHIAVYSTRDRPAWMSLLTPQISSHAVTEVHTQRGWLVIDPDNRWTSLDDRNRPWSMADLQRASGSNLPAWTHRNRARMAWIFSEPFTYLTGLYSRHGQFFPPFTPIPDINWRDFAANLFS